MLMSCVFFLLLLKKLQHSTWTIRAHKTSVRTRPAPALPNTMGKPHHHPHSVHFNSILSQWRSHEIGKSKGRDMHITAKEENSVLFWSLMATQTTVWLLIWSGLCDGGLRGRWWTNFLCFLLLFSVCPPSTHNTTHLKFKGGDKMALFSSAAW